MERKERCLFLIHQNNVIVGTVEFDRTVFLEAYIKVTLHWLYFSLQPATATISFVLSEPMQQQEDSDLLRPNIMTIQGKQALCAPHKPVCELTVLDCCSSFVISSRSYVRIISDWIVRVFYDSLSFLRKYQFSCLLDSCFEQIPVLHDSLDVIDWQRNQHSSDFRSQILA